jgi:acyl-CoA thioesterase-1
MKTWILLCLNLLLLTRPLTAQPAPQGVAIGAGVQGKPVAEQMILCLGDSLTEGYGVPEEKNWPALLQEQLKKTSGPAVRVVNSGISGATSASGPSRLKWHLKGKDKPAFMILALGANDGLRGQDVAAMKQNLAKTIAMAQEAGIKTILAGMKIPPNYGKDYAASFEKVFPDLALEYKIPLIPFLLDGVAANKDLNLPDGIHPNPQGYEIVVRNVLKVVEPLLKPKDS